MRRLLSAAPFVIAAIVLVGCTSATDAACDEIERASKKVVLVASDVLTKETTASNLEAAASEIEEYLEPLRAQHMPDELADFHADLIAELDEMVIAIRAYDTERLADISLRVAKTAVDIDVVCS